MRLKILFIFLIFPVLIFSQSPEKFSYQSVIKNSRGYLLKNQEVGLRISILFNSANGASVYSEEHTALSNDNGLITLTIGEGTTRDVFSSIDWGNGGYYLKVEVDPEGGINYVMNQTSQLLSVPYALYAGNATVNLSVIGQSYLTVSGSQITANKIDASTDVEGLSTVAISGDYTDLTNLPTLFDGDYANLTNKPTLFDGDYASLTNLPTLFDGDYANLTNKPTLFDGDYASLTNLPTLFDGDYANLTNKPTLFDGDYASLTNLPTLFDGDYANLTNKPTLFDGDYASLTNLPTLFDGDYANLTNKPTLFDGDYASLTNLPTLFDGDYANLTNKPTLFDGDYASLTNLPTLFDGDYANLTNKPTLFDGDYANLTNKPELEDGKLYIGDSDNKSAQIAVTGDVTISNTGVTAIGAQKVTNSMIADDAVGLDELANITDGSILIGGASNAPTEVAVTGDVTISNTGVTAIGAQKVTNSMIADDAVGLDELANITDGSILIGGASNAPTEVAVTGDVTISNTGVTTIGTQKVTNSMIADDAVGLDELANITQGSLLTGDSSNNPLLLDAKGTGKIIVGNGTALASVSIGGVINLASNGDVSIVDDAISYDKIQNIATANRVLGSTTADGVISEVQVATDMIADNAVNLTTKVAGTLPIANGGTGGSTANAALNSLGLYFGTVTFNGTSVTIDSISGLKSSSKIFLTFSANDGNDIYVSNINTTDSEFTLTVSGGFSSTATVNWLVIIN